MRILIVEDEPRIADFLAGGLQAEGFVADAVHSGAEAVAFAERHELDAVVLDLGLPGMDGVEVLERLVALRPEASILILSARRDIDSRLSGLRAGACDYVTKPFSFDELVEQIRIHRREAGTRRLEEVMRVGELALDVRSRQAAVGHGTVSLSTLEFRLLRYLMAHAGEVVTRQRLLSSVWGFSHEPGTNVVDVSMRRLRVKIGPERIETVRSAGYRLVAGFLALSLADLLDALPG